MLWFPPPKVCTIPTEGPYMSAVAFPPTLELRDTSAISEGLEHILYVPCPNCGRTVKPIPCTLCGGARFAEVLRH